MLGLFRRPLYVVYNPRSGGGAWAQLPSLLDEILANAHPAGMIDVTRNASLLDGLPSNARLLIVGGDGTVYSTLQQMHAAKNYLPFGIIPTGTGNMLARALRIPLDPYQAAQKFLRGKTHDADAVEINGRFISIIAASVGVHGKIIEDTPTFLKKALGMAAYFLTIIPHAFPIKQYELTVALDGSKPQKISANTFFITNTVAAFDAQPLRKAKPNDGLLHLFALHHTTPLQVMADVYELGKGKKGTLANITHLSGKSLQLWGADKLPTQIDGELLDEPLRTAKVLPKILRLIY